MCTLCTKQTGKNSTDFVPEIKNSKAPLFIAIPIQLIVFIVYKRSEPISGGRGGNILGNIMAIDIMTLCLHEKIERNWCNYVYFIRNNRVIVGRNRWSFERVRWIVPIHPAAKFSKQSLCTWVCGKYLRLSFIRKCSRIEDAAFYYHGANNSEIR